MSKSHMVFDLEVLHHLGGCPLGEIDIYSHGFGRSTFVTEGECDALLLWQRLRDDPVLSKAVVISTPHRNYYERMEELWYGQERASMLASLSIWPQFESRGLFKNTTQIIRSLKERNNEDSKFRYNFDESIQDFRIVQPQWHAVPAEKILWYCGQDIFTDWRGRNYYFQKESRLTQAIRAGFGKDCSSGEQTPTTYRAEQECLKVANLPLVFLVKSKRARDTGFSVPTLQVWLIESAARYSKEALHLLAGQAQQSQRTSTSITNQSYLQLTASSSSRFRHGKTNRYC